MRHAKNKPLAMSESLRHADGMKTQGHIIRDARTQRGLTLAQLAAMVDVDESSVSRIERGYYRGRVDTLRRIAGVLDLSLGALAGAPVRPEVTA